MKHAYLFALRQSQQLGEKIAAAAGMELSQHEERQFDDGEHKCRPLIDVRNKDVVVIHSLYSDNQQSTNDKLCRLLFFIGAVRDGRAKSITALLPYLAYARKDQKTKPFDPTTTRYIANLFRAVGTDRVVTLGAHNRAALENAFQCWYEDIDARLLFVNYFASRLQDGNITVLAPDSGAIKNAQRFLGELSETRGRNIELAIMSKTRSLDRVESSEVYGDVAGRTVVIYDDMISSGTTVCHAIESCERRGVKEVFVAATHGVFTAKVNQLLDFNSLVEVVTTNSIDSPFIDRVWWGKKLVTLDCAPLLAEFLD